ncbi:MAG: hypothetical protein NVSMB56_19440 [Pyrinomonadaceae bacterium]
MFYSIVFNIYRALMMFGSIVCHQRAERSPHLLGVQLPLCWRCSGIFIGSCVLIFWLIVYKKLPRLRLSLILALLMPLDVFTAMIGMWHGDNTVRYVTGALWGIFGTSLILQMLPHLLKLSRLSFRPRDTSAKTARA